GHPHVERKHVVMLPGENLVANLGNQLVGLRAEPPAGEICIRGGLFQDCVGGNHLPRNKVGADAKGLERALCLRAPELVGWNRDFSKTIRLYANFGHGLSSSWFVESESAGTAAQRLRARRHDRRIARALLPERFCWKVSSWLNAACSAVDSGAWSAKSQSTLTRDCFHQQRERLVEAGFSDAAPLVVSEAHHHQLVRRNDHRSLSTGAAHVVRILGNGKAAIPIDPEEATVNMAIVRSPSGGQGAGELDVALW